MIILLSGSSGSASAMAGHLRGAMAQPSKGIAKGRFVLYYSNDLRAAKLAVRLGRRKAVTLNTALLFYSLVGIFGGATLLNFFQSGLAMDVGPMGFYSGVIVGLCLIGLESIPYSGVRKR